MKKPATVTDWRNKPRSVANNELEKKAELFAALSVTFVITADGSLPPLERSLQDLKPRMVRHYRQSFKT